jgi:hypothetical protein
MPKVVLLRVDVVGREHKVAKFTGSRVESAQYLVPGKNMLLHGGCERHTPGFRLFLHDIGEVYLVPGEALLYVHLNNDTKKDLLPDFI